MQKSKTLFINYQKQDTNFSKFKKFIYKFCNSIWYKLKDKVVIFLERINFYEWKRPLLLKIIDILWNASLIALMWFCWLQNNLLLKGIAITLFFILLQSYVKEYKELFEKKR